MLLSISGDNKVCVNRVSMVQMQLTTQDSLPVDLLITVFEYNKDYCCQVLVTTCTTQGDPVTTCVLSYLIITQSVKGT